MPDVVPVDPSTVDEWEHPPYSGYFDGKYLALNKTESNHGWNALLGERIWGRGSSDDKSGLIGIMSSIESLLEKNFVPSRSVVLTFGFDEEASGPQVGHDKFNNWLKLNAMTREQHSSASTFSQRMAKMLSLSW